jgi:hypothetical protein
MFGVRIGYGPRTLNKDNDGKRKKVTAITAIGSEPV